MNKPNRPYDWSQHVAGRAPARTQVMPDMSNETAAVDNDFPETAEAIRNLAAELNIDAQAAEALIQYDRGDDAQAEPENRDRAYIDPVHDRRFDKPQRARRPFPVKRVAAAAVLFTTLAAGAGVAITQPGFIHSIGGRIAGLGNSFANKQGVSLASPGIEASNTKTAATGDIKIIPLDLNALTLNPADQCVTRAIRNALPSIGKEYDSQSAHETGKYFVFPSAAFNGVVMKCQQEKFVQGYAPIETKVRDGWNILARVDAPGTYKIASIAMPGAVETLAPLSERAVIKVSGVDQTQGSLAPNKPMGSRKVTSVTVRPDGSIVNDAAAEKVLSGNAEALTPIIQNSDLPPILNENVTIAKTVITPLAQKTVETAPQTATPPVMPMQRPKALYKEKPVNLDL